MLQRRMVLAGAGLATLMACADQPPSTAPEATDAARVSSSNTPAAPENLARAFARALRNPSFRAYVKAQLDASPFRENKLQFQTFVGAHDARGLRALAAENRVAEDVILADVQQAIPLEFYLPVPAHRAAWTGDENLLVATALNDRDAPVAFDLAGRRHVLRADRPPATPVLALVPVETDFTPRPQFEICLACDGEGGGGTPPASPAGLYMTKSHLVDDFEGWLKGAPEIEVHILGQRGTSDTMVSYQCAAATQPTPYYFDQNGLDWSGSVLLFSKSQLDQYNAAHPNKNVRVFFIEDDDAACDIRTDRNRLQELFRAVDAAYKSVTAGNDSSSGLQRRFKRASGLYRILAALAAWIKSNDDPIGNAVEDPVVGSIYPGYNWFLKGDNNVTNGWIRLEMR